MWTHSSRAVRTLYKHTLSRGRASRHLLQDAVAAHVGLAAHHLPRQLAVQVQPAHDIMLDP